jgi:hypothetical protein
VSAEVKVYGVGNEPSSVTCGLEIYNFLTSLSIADAFGRGRRRVKFQEKREYKKLNSLPSSKVIVDSDGDLRLNRWPPLVDLNLKDSANSAEVKPNGVLRLNLIFDFKLHPRVLLVKSVEGTILKAYHLNTTNSALAALPVDAIPARPTSSNLKDLSAEVKSYGVMHGF